MKPLHEHGDSAKSSEGPQPGWPQDGKQPSFPILLLTEDDQVIRRARRLLEPGGYTIDVFHSGRDALEVLEQKRHMICFVDQDLIDISGFEVVGQGKVASPITEFVMLFEYPNLSRAMLALSYGAFGYLAKPFDDLGMLLTKVILAREKVSTTLQLRALMETYAHHQQPSVQTPPGWGETPKNVGMK